MITFLCNYPEAVEVSAKIALRNSVGLGAFSAAKTATPSTITAVPGTFNILGWTVAGTGTTGQIAVTLYELPPANNSAIIRVDYRIDGGTWTDLGAITLDTPHAIGSLTDDVAVDVELRAVNAVGAGATSDVKTATPSAGAEAPTALAVSITPGTLVFGDTATAVITFSNPQPFPYPTLDIQWTIDTVDVTGQTGLTYEGVGAGALRVVVTATNASGSDGPVTSSPVTVTALAPGAFSQGQWAVEANGTSGELEVTMFSLPPANGAAISSVERAAGVLTQSWFSDTTTQDWTPNGFDAGPFLASHSPWNVNSRPNAELYTDLIYGGANGGKLIVRTNDVPIGDGNVIGAPFWMLGRHFNTVSSTNPFMDGMDRGVWSDDITSLSATCTWSDRSTDPNRSQLIAFQVYGSVFLQSGDAWATEGYEMFDIQVRPSSAAGTNFPDLEGTVTTSTIGGVEYRWNRAINSNISLSDTRAYGFEPTGSAPAPNLKAIIDFVVANEVSLGQVNPRIRIYGVQAWTEPREGFIDMAMTDFTVTLDGTTYASAPVWAALAGVSVDTAYTVSGLLDLEPTDVTLRAVNSAGNGAAGDTKAATPTDSLLPETVGDNGWTFQPVQSSTDLEVFFGVDTTSWTGYSLDPDLQGAVAVMKAIIISGPVNLALPTISGDSGVGDTKTADKGRWATGEGVTSYAYQWNRDASPIGSATAETYVLVGDDAGTDLTVTVTATDPDGATAATSAADAIPSAGTVPATMSAPTLAGGAEQVTLTLASAPSDGGSVITEYDYEVDAAVGDFSAPIVQGMVTPAELATPIVISPLAVGDYKARNRAVNTIGDGDWSAASTTAAAADTPDADYTIGSNATTVTLDPPPGFDDWTNAETAPDETSITVDGDIIDVTGVRLNGSTGAVTGLSVFDGATPGDVARLTFQLPAASGVDLLSGPPTAASDCTVLDNGNGTFTVTSTSGNLAKFSWPIAPTIGENYDWSLTLDTSADRFGVIRIGGPTADLPSATSTTLFSGTPVDGAQSGTRTAASGDAYFGGLFDPAAGGETLLISNASFGQDEATGSVEVIIDITILAAPVVESSDYFVAVQTHQTQTGANSTLRAKGLEVGASMLRDGTVWSTAETSPGIYSFTSNKLNWHDDAMDSGLDLLLVLHFGNPLYDGGNIPYTSGGRTAMGNYAVAILDNIDATYSGARKAYIEIGNEVNNSNFLNGPILANGRDLSWEYYDDMFDEVSTIIKASHPDAYVIAGGSHSHQGRWFQQLWAHPGGFPNVDAWALHPYASAPEPESVIQHTAILNALKPASEQGKPWWFTEWGSEGSGTEAEKLANAQYFVPRFQSMFAWDESIEQSSYYALPYQANFLGMQLLNSDGTLSVIGQSFKTWSDMVGGLGRPTDIGPDNRTFCYRFGPRRIITWGYPRVVTGTGFTWYDHHGTSLGTGAQTLDPEKPIYGICTSDIVVGENLNFAASNIVSHSYWDYNLGYPRHASPLSYLYYDTSAKPCPVELGGRNGFPWCPVRSPGNGSFWMDANGIVASATYRGRIRFTAPATKTYSWSVNTAPTSGGTSKLRVYRNGALIDDPAQHTGTLARSGSVAMTAGDTLDVEIARIATSGRNRMTFIVTE